jgi:serine/threonine-protein kinase RsbW
MPARRSDVTEDTAATTAVPGPRDPAARPSNTAPSNVAQSNHDMVRDHVQVTLPAEGAYLSVLRTATAGLAARLDFTLDEIEDLRIAVDEACAMLLPQAIPGTSLECGFDLDGDRMTITVSVVAAQPRMPAKDTFAWTVLSALAGTVEGQLGPGDQVSVVLRKRRSADPGGRPAGAPGETPRSG